VNAEFEVLGKGFIEFLVLLFIFSKLVEQLNRFFHKILLDDSEDLILLESLARNIER